MSRFLNRRVGLSVKKMREALKLLLSYEAWYMSSNIPRIDVISAQPAVDEVMTKVQESFPSEAKKKTVILSQKGGDGTTNKKRKCKGRKAEQTILDSRSMKVRVEEGCNGCKIQPKITS